MGFFQLSCLICLLAFFASILVLDGENLLKAPSCFSNWHDLLYASTDRGLQLDRLTHDRLVNEIFVNTLRSLAHCEPRALTAHISVDLDSFRCRRSLIEDGHALQLL